MNKNKFSVLVYTVGKNLVSFYHWTIKVMNRNYAEVLIVF